MRDAIDPAKMTVLCGLGTCNSRTRRPSAVPARLHDANFAPELSLALLEAADACVSSVRDLMVKIAPLYEFAGSARPRGRDPWVLPDYTAAHLRRCSKAANGNCGLASGPVREPGRRSDPGERAELKAIFEVRSGLTGGAI